MKSSNHRGDGCTTRRHRPTFILGHELSSMIEVQDMNKVGKLALLIVGFSIAFTVYSDSALSVHAQSKPINFSLHTLDGGSVSSSSLTGKVVVLALGGKNDPLDQSLLPQLQRIIDRYQGKPVVVVWVANDSTKIGARNYATDQDIRGFVSRAKFTGTVARDPDGALIRALGTNQLPTIALIDKRGNVVAPLIIGFDPDSQETVIEMSGRIDKLLS